MKGPAPPCCGGRREHVLTRPPCCGPWQVLRSPVIFLAPVFSQNSTGRLGEQSGQTFPCKDEGSCLSAELGLLQLPRLGGAQFSPWKVNPANPRFLWTREWKGNPREGPMQGPWAWPGARINLHGSRALGPPSPRLRKGRRRPFAQQLTSRECS